MRQIKRDPFARATLMRQGARTSTACRWCGSRGRNDYLYLYRWEPDAGRPTVWCGYFCSVSCYRSYSGDDR
jgi:hypothetical protein